MRNLISFVLGMLLGGGGFVVVRDNQSMLVRECRRWMPASLLEKVPWLAPDDAGRTAEAPARPAQPSQPSPPAREPQPARRLVDPPDERAQPAPSSLTGTLVVLDERGGEHAAEDGVLALRLGPSGARTLREVEVRDGRWNLTLAPGEAGRRTGALVLGACLLGERVARPAPRQAVELSIPSDGRIELRLRWPAAPRLHVRARDTGRELDEVLLYELPTLQRGSSRDTLHPGLEAKPRSTGPSPITLAGGESTSRGAPRVLFARSPGYAWGRLELDPGLDEEPTLTLDRAGTLELAVVGESAERGLEILLQEAEPPHAEVLALVRGKAASFRIEDLRAGRYRVEARFYGLPSGALEVEVRAAESVQAVLEVAGPAAAGVPFGGVLELPEEYGTNDFMLEFLLQGRLEDGSLTRDSFEIRSTEMMLERGSPRRFRWSTPAARPARYRILLSSALRFATELDTGPSGRQDARLVVPPPCLVSLRCLDEQSGAEVSGEKVSWTPLTPRALSVSHGPARAGIYPANLEFQVPQGRLLVFTTPERYEPVARLVEVGPGTNEILLRMRKKP